MAEHTPTQDRVFQVRPDFGKTAHMDAAGYHEAYRQAAENPDAYWAQEAKRIEWMTFPTKIKNASFTGDVSIKWFEDGGLDRRG